MRLLFLTAFATVAAVPSLAKADGAWVDAYVDMLFLFPLISGLGLLLLGIKFLLLLRRHSIEDLVKGWRAFQEITADRRRR